MTNTARTGRRRRMLQEGAAASTTPAGGEPQAATHRRYTPPEGSASFAVAGGVLPRSPLALTGLAVLLVVAITMLVGVDGLGIDIAKSGVSAQAAQLLMIDQPGGLARWYEGSLWLAVAVQSILLFGLRKHRTNDTGGAYRWWLVVAGVAIGMSLGVATQAQGVVATQLAGLTGFSPLASDAFWWFAPGALVLLGVGVRSLLEVRESRLAGLSGGLSLTLLGLGGLASAGLTPSALAGFSPLLAAPMLGPIASLAGVSLGLICLLGYSRRIVRETLGELAPPRTAVKPVAAEKAAAEQASDEVETTASPKAKRTAPAKHVMKVAERTREAKPTDEPELVPTAAQRRAERKRAAEAAKQETADDNRWVSGPEGDEEYGDDGPERRKLSKAERKRLRREKQRNAA